MGKPLDLTGQRFGRLIVVERDYSHCGNQTYWRCLCDCGNYTVCRGTHLISGGIRSCGCFALDLRTNHGWCGSPEYRTYYNILKRCYDQNDNRFSDYGGRGIKVCDRWLDGFENFIADMGQRPGKEFSIDRIDVNGDYTPDNCKWSNRIQQARNTRVRKDSKTGVRGVTVKGNRFHAQLYCNGENHDLGWYGTIQEAVAARKTAETIYWGGGDAQ